MANPAREHHGQERGDHGKHDQSRGDANDLLHDGFPKHASRPSPQLPLRGEWQSFVAADQE
jgi:hypothetical protein